MTKTWSETFGNNMSAGELLAYSNLQGEGLTAYLRESYEWLAKTSPEDYPGNPDDSQFAAWAAEIRKDAGYPDAVETVLIADERAFDCLPDDLLNAWGDNGGDSDGNAYMPSHPVSKGELPAEVFENGWALVVEATYYESPAAFAEAHPAADVRDYEDVSYFLGLSRGYQWAGFSARQIVLALWPAEVNQ